ncbi:MAG: acyltransferase [Dehalococcoidia bacterium]|jgi:acetyltransferase-like isoleucine patch superfamily enzyme
MEVNEGIGQDGASEGLRFLEDVYRYSGGKRSLLEHLKSIRAQMALELSEMHWAFLLANALLAPIPKEAGGRLRPLVYRMIGIRIGRGTCIGKGWHIEGMGRPYGRLTIGEHCYIRGVRFELNAPIRIGNRVVVSDGVLITTDRHEVGSPQQRMGHIRSRPVTIGDGAWVQRQAMVLGVDVGAGAIVGSGAVVTKDVPPNTFVAGVPARIVRELPVDSGQRVEEKAVEQ